MSEESNEVVEAPLVNESAKVEEKPVSKFASLYAETKEAPAKEALEVKDPDATKPASKNVADMSWEEKNAWLEENGIDYGEWTDHLADDQETDNEKEWREMREWKSKEEERLNGEKKSFAEHQKKEQETTYVKSLIDIVAADTENYELVSAHPQKDALLLHHARNYAQKFNEVPDSKELVSFVEEELLKEAMPFLKSKKIRALLSKESEGSSWESEEPSKTLSNQDERYQSNVEVKTDRMETRDERIARITNKNH